jgi:transposase
MSKVWLAMRGRIEGQATGDERKVRGREIASHPETIEKVAEDEWSVSSQTGFGRYRVVLTEGAWVCSCKDFEKRRVPCKHILAVREIRRRKEPAELTYRKQYSQHSTYTRGQTEEMRLVDTLLRELVSTVPDFPRAPGLPGPAPTPLHEELYAAILKVYSGLSGRRACGVYRNVADRGLLTRAPSYAVASNLLTRAEITPILNGLLHLSATPLAGLEEGGTVAPDSTGVQTTSFGGWREEKHREQRKKMWIKVHAIVGTKTHVIVRAIVSDKNTGDAPEFGPLLRGAVEWGFHPSRVVADKGYMSAENYALAAGMGIEPVIPFRAGTVSNEVNRIRGVTKPEAWTKAYHLFQANRGEFNRRYHARSNVESVFSALKRKFGENIRSRTSVSQVNEVLAKLICYNLTVVVHEMFENGIAPYFAAPVTSS